MPLPLHTFPLFMLITFSVRIRVYLVIACTLHFPHVKWTHNIKITVFWECASILRRTKHTQTQKNQIQTQDTLDGLPRVVELLLIELLFLVSYAVVLHVGIRRKQSFLMTCVNKFNFLRGRCFSSFIIQWPILSYWGWCLMLITNLVTHLNGSPHEWWRELNWAHKLSVKCWHVCTALGSFVLQSQNIRRWIMQTVTTDIQITDHGFPSGCYLMYH